MYELYEGIENDPLLSSFGRELCLFGLYVHVQTIMQHTYQRHANSLMAKNCSNALNKQFLQQNKMFSIIKFIFWMDHFVIVYFINIPETRVSNDRFCIFLQRNTMILQIVWLISSTCVIDTKDLRIIIDYFKVWLAKVP